MFVTVNDCKNFTMAGVKLLDAPEFNVALNGVTGAEVHDVNITSTWYVDPKSGELKEPHNTDAIDPGGGSSDIHIHDVWVHNGDDSVAVKPSKLGDCTRNILVEDSHFEFGHGCSIGSVGSGCVENVLFRNITMRKQECGCRVKTYSESAGHVRNITWRGITIDDTGDCVTVNANYKPVPKDPKHFIDVSGLTFADIVGTNCKRPPEFVCPEQAPCTGITLDSVKLSGIKGKGDFKMDCLHAEGTAADGVVPDSCLEAAPLPLPPSTAHIRSCDDGGTEIKGFKVATTPPNETDVPATQDTVAHVCWDGVGLHIRENATGSERWGVPGVHLTPWASLRIVF